MGIIGVLVLLLAPFGFLKTPELPLILLALIAGGFRISALFAFFTALRNFETSRIVPAIGGFLPLFTLGLVYFASKDKEALEVFQILAFLLLISGSVLISFERKKSITLKSLQISILTAFLFAVSFLLSKLVYLSQSFWPGFIWIMLGQSLIALFFLFSKEVREELFKKQISFKLKTAKVFLANQILGASAVLLQNWGVSLVPLKLLAFVNALEGTKYAFLLIFTILISLKFPKIIKEEISKKVLLQKIIAIILIGGGLILLAI